MSCEGTVRARSSWRYLNRALPLLVVFAAIAFPATAQAAPPPTFIPCTGAQAAASGFSSAAGLYCGTVSVPIDRSGLVTTNTIPLNVIWKPALVADTEGALLALAGGPGQAATPYASEFATALAPALGTRDLVVFDQRGTGKSGLLDCPGAQNAANLQQLVETCSTELGPARDFYSSKDSADDIEAVRQAIGVDRITIYGVSYGTYVEQLYAKLYPDHTAALVLDSVVSSNGIDPFSLSNFAAVRSVLASNCMRSLCRGITPNALNDLASVVRRSTAGGVPLRYVGANGITHRFRVNQMDLLNFMIEDFSLDAVVRARFPAALRSTLAGDPYPLGRLLAPVPSTTTSSNVSTALYIATSCSDTHFPWLSSDPPAVRQSAANSALAALPASDFSPFSPSTALAVSNIDLCVNWPASTVDDSVSAPFPDIPVLTLSGLEDDLTPLTDAAMVASQFPSGIRVNIPFTGHSVISDVWPNADTCVRQAITRFFSHVPIPSCSYVKPFFRPVSRDPSTLAQVKPLRLKGLPGKTLGAVIGTLSDVTTSVFSTGPSGGLRGGYFNGSVMNIRLHKVVYVPGIVVSGRMDVVSGDDAVTVSGVGSHGTLSVQRGRNFTSVTGTLDGQRLKIRFRTQANDSKVATQLPILIGMQMANRRLPVTPSSLTMPASSPRAVSAMRLPISLELWG